MAALNSSGSAKRCAPRLWTVLIAATAVALLASGATAETPKRKSDDEKLAKPSARTQAKIKAFIAEDVPPELLIELDPRASKVFHTRKQVTRVAITRPEIVEVNVYSPTQLEMVPGKKGETTLTLWFGDQSLRYLVRVESKAETSRR